MKRRKPIALDFEIDSLTNSIRNPVSGDSFPTEISLLTKADLNRVTKKNEWAFNWRSEFNNNAKSIYKLTIVGNPNIIQGLLSFTIQSDHIYMDLLESVN